MTTKQMLAMMRTAEVTGHRPKRWVISRLADRRLKLEAYDPIPNFIPLQKIYGIPVEVDERAADGWGLVVE